MNTDYIVKIDGALKDESFTDLETAIRRWNALTYNRPGAAGGIAVHTWDNGLMVRDGWILHVYPNGHTYLSPRLANVA